MNVDGAALAHKLQEELTESFAQLPERLVLSVVSLSTSSATEQFVGMKKQVGEALGVSVRVVTPTVTTTAELVETIDGVVAESHGVLVQLPVPNTFDLIKTLNAVPRSYDVDVLGKEGRTAFEEGTSSVLPPVVAAMREILVRHDIVVKDKRVVVVGEGRLVGAPAAVWFRQQGAQVHVANKKTADLAELTKHADIIVLGAGSPGLLSADMVKDGVVVLDAGSGEVGGRVRGDADPDIDARALLFTPTPGGIGPIAVTMIFVNLLTLWQERKKK